MNPIDTISMRRLAAWLVATLILAGCGGGDSGTFTPLPPATPVVVSADVVPWSGVVTNSYNAFSFSANGGSPPYTWSVSSGKLPDGLSLAPDGTLSGTPTTAGSFNFTVKATDSAATQGSGTHAFSVTIDAPAALAIDPGQLPPPGVHGTPYGAWLSASGGYLPLHWTITAGALPPGLAINADGTVTGTPTAASSTPYTFTLTVTDSAQPTAQSSSAPYSITISEPPPPTIYNSALPTATVGVPYSFAFGFSDGLAPFVWTPPSTPMAGLAFSADGVLSGTPTASGIYPITLMVTDSLHQDSPLAHFTLRVANARPAAGFTQTGNMTAPRNGHTSTLLLDGRVLIVGGGPQFGELYDPTTRLFTATGSNLSTAGARSATLLANPGLPNYGKVLVTGGSEVIAELYDPATGAFTATGSTLVAHWGESATLLKNGKALIAGGATASAELFDPASGTFSATGSMSISRSWHSATLLADGRVLVAGGTQNDAGPLSAACCAEASAEIYDPASGSFTAVGSMGEGRLGHKAVLLADGTVLVTGNDGTAELFNPATGSFVPAGAPATHSGATVTLRNDGTVLVAGGRARTSYANADLFAPESGGFVQTGQLLTARDGHTATLLTDGSVLVTGGINHQHHCVRGWGCIGQDVVQSSAELFK